jgi:hypothetical protein
MENWALNGGCNELDYIHFLIAAQKVFSNAEEGGRTRLST